MNSQLNDIENIFTNKKLENLSDFEIEKVIEASLNKMDEEKVNKIGKNTRSFYVLCFTTFLLGSLILISFGILYLIPNMTISKYEDHIVSGIVFILIGLFTLPFLFLFFKPTKRLKWNLKEWACFHEKRKLKNMQKQILQNQKNIYNQTHIDGKEIKFVTILDSFTEFSDKLHAFLNYQEIIQTRIYKFLVTFTDNSTKIFTEKEGSNIYNILVRYLNQPVQPKEITSSNADEIMKYKTLLDNHAITQKEFEEKKKELLKE